MNAIVDLNKYLRRDDILYFVQVEKVRAYFKYLIGCIILFFTFNHSIYYMLKKGCAYCQNCTLYLEVL